MVKHVLIASAAIIMFSGIAAKAEGDLLGPDRQGNLCKVITDRDVLHGYFKPCAPEKTARRTRASR
jgi:hypothetical protein